MSLSDDPKLKKTLKEKAGNGGIPKHLLDDAHSHMCENDIDFRSMATKHLEIIDEQLKKLNTFKDEHEQQVAFETIIENIMQIKAHGGMFNYEVMSQIAGIALSFLEDAKEINEDLLKLIEAHNNSIRLVIARNIKGDGGEQGQAIVSELQKAVTRYSKKHNN